MRKLLVFAAVLLLAFGASAQNPLVSTSYTPDPAPYVHDGKVYMFTGHDEDDATYFLMKDWQVFSTEDMVNWTYLGTQMSTATFEWAEQGDNACTSCSALRMVKTFWIGTGGKSINNNL